MLTCLTLVTQTAAFSAVKWQLRPGIRRISTVSNAIEIIDNEMICFIIYCLNCIRHGRNATYERGLTIVFSSSFVMPGKPASRILIF